MSNTIICKCFVKEGKGLKHPDLLSNPNPFVEFHYENSVVGTTKSVHHTVNPVWNEEVDIPFTFNNDKLDIIVKDSKIFF